MDSNIAQFNGEVDRYAKEIVPGDLIKFQKKIAFEGLVRIVNKTPVKTGYARGNWLVSVGNPMETTVERLDKEGGMTIKAGMAVLEKLPPYQIVYISNNVIYIEALEHGHSKIQAPEGMVAVTVEELKAMFP